MDSASGKLPFTLGVEIQKEFRSERVKSVDLHPTEPWILASLHSGTVLIWNHQSQSVEKSFHVTNSPVRSAKFIVGKKWLVTGADDKFIRLYNYTTNEMIEEFEAHEDFIRSVAVHPTLPYVLSSSDDMTVKLWDWEKDWACTKVFRGHSHYVMQVAFSPIDNSVFVSASLDCTAKIWNLGSSEPLLTLEGHSKGINCVEFLKNGDKPYLVTGSDDFTAKIWDYNTATSIKTLQGHEHNVTAISVHPEVPIMIIGSEDESFHIWHASDYSLLSKKSSGLGRVWATGFTRGSSKIVIGCDGGIVVGKYSNEETQPV